MGWGWDTAIASLNLPLTMEFPLKVTLDVPDAALIKVANNPDKYLGPLLISLGAELLRQIREVEVNGSSPLPEASTSGKRRIKK